MSFVVKIGGAEGVGIDGIVADLATLWNAGRRGIVVHGGSDETNRLATALGHPSRFVTSVSGQVSRLTDRRTLEIYLMATAAVNRRIVAGLQARGVNAVGISGIDGRTLMATRKDVLRVIENGRQRVVRDDWTGNPERCNATLLRLLLDAGCLPVVAPVGLSGLGEPLNVDGDRAAACIAGGMAAETLVILSNVPGLLRRFPDETTLMAHVPLATIDAAESLAAGRMKKKILGAREALHAGVRRVIIGDGRVAAPLTAALEGRGTTIGEALSEGAEASA